MRRFLLVFLLNLAAVVVLTWFAGGARGPAATGPEPSVETSAGLPASDERIVPPGRWPLAIHGAQGVWLPTDPEPITVSDRESGTQVLVPDFERYTFQAVESKPVDAGTASRQAAQALGVEVKVYREPRTLEEARALNAGAPDAKARLLKWVIEAPVAQAEFLQEGLSITERRQRASADEAVIVLRGGVRLHDLEEDLVVDGEEIELEPGRGFARGRGIFVVTHPSFELVGEDLELSRDETEERVVVVREAYVQIQEELTRPDGAPLLDLGGEEFRPGFVRAAGGARIVREKAFGRQRLEIVLEDDVHAEQEGGRTLDAERVSIQAWRPLEGGEDDDWRLQLFQAEGGAVLQYPEVAEDGTPVLISVRGQQIIHRLADDGTSTTRIKGRPHFDLRGDMRLRGFAGNPSLGLLSASAAEEAWIGLPGPGDVPPGEDPAQFLRLVLHGGATLERRDSGVDRDWDRLEGDQLTMLLRRVETPRGEDAEADRSRSAVPGQDRLVAVSFDLLGDVTLSGTRMSGTTDHLYGERLDTAAPLVVAEGGRTDFRFHGIRSGERLLGGNRDAEASPGTGSAGDGAEGAAGGAAERDWVLERLRALGRVDVHTSLGGPTVGRPAHIEGAELAYDRTTDRARLLGDDTAPAQVSVGDPSRPRHNVRARRMTFERRSGIVRADGTVQGSVYLAGDEDRGPAGLAALGLGDPEVGAPSYFRVTTPGRVEIRALLAEARRGPRLDADQVLRIEGGVVAEMVADTEAVDTLRAEIVEVALRRVELGPEARMTAPLARAAAPGGRRATVPDTPAPGNAKPRVRWDLEAEVLSARIGDAGLLGVEALEGAVIRSEDGEIRGRRIAYDARLREATVRGSPDLDAQAIFGRKETRNEVWSPSMTLELDTDGPKRLVAQGTARAVLIRRTNGQDGPRWERFDATSDAPIVVRPEALEVDGLVNIRRRLRKAPGAPWEPPAELRAWHLLVEGEDLLRGRQEGADIRRVIASGPETWFSMEVGKGRVQLWSRRLELDVPTSLATLTGAPGEKVRVAYTQAAGPRSDSEYGRIVLDLKTGRIKDMDPSPLILPGGAGR